MGGWEDRRMAAKRRRRRTTRGRRTRTTTSTSGRQRVRLVTGNWQMVIFHFRRISAAGFFIHLVFWEKSVRTKTLGRERNRGEWRGKVGKKFWENKFDVSRETRERTRKVI